VNTLQVNQSKRSKQILLKQLHALAALAALSSFMSVSPLAAEPHDADDSVTFNMVVSAGAKTCLPNASGTVKIRPAGPVEIMEVSVQGLPPNTEFEFFVIQVPKAQFGVSWYQGEIDTDKNGRGHGQFVGRFSIETFAVAPGTAAAPVVFTGAFPDASLNPPFNPIQMYHLGLWFGSPQAAQSASCPATVTPFSGDHAAGIQVLNTSNFADDHGPLRDVTPSTAKSKD
jgi:hypothetical protein